jgi:hypothetical protein
VSQITGERERIIEVFYLHHDMAIYQEQNYDIEDFLSVMEEIVANSYATRSYP